MSAITSFAASRGEQPLVSKYVELVRTDAGLIPTDWQVKPLSQWAEKIMVGIASAATYAYRPSGVPLLRNQNIKPGYLLDCDILYVDPKYEARFARKRLAAGDLLTARTGYPGMTCVVPSKYEAAQSFTTLITRPKKNEIESEYLCHYINSERGQAFFEANKIGGAQKNINAGLLKKMPIPAPAIEEQRAIAATLSDADALIGRLDDLIAKKRAMKLAVSQQLLTGRARLTGFRTVPETHICEIGVLPRDWTVRRLGDIGSSFIGLTFSPDQVSPDGHLVLRASNIGGSGLQFEDSLYVQMPIPEKLLLKPDDLLICVRNGSRPLIGKCALVDCRATGMTFGAFMTVFRSASNPFIFHCFQSDVIKKQIHEHLGATINQITNKSLTSFLVPWPSEVERNAIVRVLSDMDTEIVALEHRRKKSEAIKLGMMQALLTGRVRFATANPQAEPEPVA